MPISCWMRRSGQPSLPSAMTCCRFSSLKTLLTSLEGNPSIVLNVLPIPIGRFSAVPHWPVLGVPRGADYELLVIATIDRLQYEDWDAIGDRYGINTDETR